jgi:ElaB/YqjD/DUF883 family membrane-anchored ribosome-binding protein
MSVSFLKANSSKAEPQPAAAAAELSPPDSVDRHAGGRSGDRAAPAERTHEEITMNPSFTTTNGENVATEASRTAERLADAAGDTAAKAGGAARERADQAQRWAKSRWSDLQQSVEAQPYQSTAWALGIGFAAGLLVMGLLRGRR